jgi:hypothetical protein
VNNLDQLGIAILWLNESERQTLVIKRDGRAEETAALTVSRAAKRERKRRRFRRLANFTREGK